MSRAVIIGTGGGIGAALVETAAASGRYETVFALSRSPDRPGQPGVVPGVIDVSDPDSIAGAARDIGAPIDLVIVATGLLHDAGGGPERSLKALDAERLSRSFAINTIGPALVLQHFVPLLARDRRAVIACLSARVGSISDNRSGGWYGYRASKAALNQIVRCAAIEMGRTHKHALCVALHPGTVATALSAPFRSSVPPGKLFTPAFSAERLLAVIDGLNMVDSGRIFAWDGAEIDP
ncbi:SDR family NAD(P)-dependent oxidoreductase [Sphingomonas sp. 1P06PA]|uniref:SDR family NAD(P)-dependent oxidoreductase n=1 Tax=Sphingomonas sp. 1P06PA TaxID=554121 RepID=UPI0039A5D4A0